MGGIKTSARAYEDWLRREVGADFVPAALKEKHRKMRSGPFAFLRATYWRWAETILDICPELGDAPAVLSIGDAHLENFGTWRDAEGRLVWGANDFDDAAVMPYPLDLVRLAASALLARPDAGPGAREICAPILAGYRSGIADPLPFVLEREHKWLRDAVLLPESHRTAFWKGFDRIEPGAVPDRYARALAAAMPDGGTDLLVGPRTAGTGSLGRPRFLARKEWAGGSVLREAKAIVLSGWSLHHDRGAAGIRAGEIAAGAARAADPCYSVSDGIVVRRLSPSSRKIEVEDGAGTLLSPEMLTAMGREIANCHAGDAGRLPDLGDDLARRGGDWLRQAAKSAAKTVAREQADFA